MPNNHKTKRFLITPVIMTLLAGAAVLLLWTALRKDQESRVSEIVEAVSYSARSEIARQLIVQFRAFDSIRTFWSNYAMTPVDQWETDAMIEIDHFEGLDVIAWAESDGPRFFSAGPNIALDHTPTDAEWEVIRNSLEEASTADSDTVIGPVIDDSGHAVLHLHLPVRNGGREAVMLAIIDITEQVGALLNDDSPGYDILVTCCDGVEIFRTGDFDADIPESWIRSGLIEPVSDVLLRIQHQPSGELASRFRPWALNFVLISGLALALAIGSIAYYSGRANDRARAATVAEQTVRSLNKDLERKVEQRTRALNEALADLNTINLSVAHDVRSPLNAAGLTIEVLMAGSNGDNDVTAQFNRVKSNLNQIDVILDRLMALSNVSSFKTESQRLDLEALAHQVGRELIGDGEAKLTVGNMPRAHIDPTMAHILMTNLMSNAIRHSTSDGAAEIEVGAYSDGDETTYFVRDHGPGIDPSVRDALFKPIRRPRSEVRNGGGMGLGLAIAARIVARHGGTIWSEDTDGGGATFCFKLPDDADDSRSLD